MDVRIGFAEFDAQAQPVDVRIGWAEFDALGQAVDVRVGWAEFDARAQPFHVCVSWCELDVRSPTADPVPPFQPGSGVARYHSNARKKYEIPVSIHDEDEEEEIIMAILTEIAAHALV